MGTISFEELAPRHNHYESSILNVLPAHWCTFMAFRNFVFCDDVCLGMVRLHRPR